jgi:hypothetical protein
MFVTTIEEDLRGIVRHWDGVSEKYAGGDSLLTALYTGWKLPEVVFVERHWHAGSRRVNVYHFKLTCDGDSLTMPVIGNPFVTRLLMEHNIRLIPVAKLKAPTRREATRKTTPVSALVATS